MKVQVRAKKDPDERGPGRSASACPAFWAQEPAAVAATVESSSVGLDDAQARARLARHGPNTVVAHPSRDVLTLFLAQYRSPLVLILLFGAAVSSVLHEWVDAAIVLAIVVGSTLLGFTQEFRASRAVERLRQSIELKARVLRDGAPATIPVRNVVPGDVVLLAAGNLVPADGLLLEAHDFMVTEAALTGESLPVEKRPGVVALDAPLVERTNSVFLGTSVRSGTARMLVVDTGAATAFGGVAGRLAARPPETDFARGLRQFGYLLTQVMVVVVLFVLTANLLLHRPVIESLLFSVALAVGLSPELLPAIVSVTLSTGARAMARRGVIVRRLEAIENLGSMDVLCTDKTGTLTEGAVALDGAVDADRKPSPEILRAAYANAALQKGLDNPLDAALVEAGRGVGIDISDFRKVDEIPYDFQRKRLTVVVDDLHSGSQVIITKGAFSGVLECCNRVSCGAGQRELDAGLRARLEAAFRERSEAGYRVLGLAVREAGPRSSYGREDERDMTFAGFLLFVDPPKQGTVAAIRALADLGVGIKVITGDNRYVASNVAEAVGLDARTVVTGAQLDAMRDEALWHVAENANLFVEVGPQHKERIVRALQRRGHVVGYIGDGINDAPALHAADVGVSVDSAVDVARDTADIVMLRPGLEALRNGIEDGRRTFANTLKYIAITTSANFGNMVSMSLAALFMPFLPLLPKQILLNNFLSDIPALAIAGDDVARSALARAQRWSLPQLRSFMLIFGLVSTLFDILTFVVLIRVFRADTAMFRTAWFVVSVLTELAVVLVLRTRLPFYRSRPSTLLIGATVAVALLTVSLPYAGALATVFDFVRPSLAMLPVLVLIVLLYVATTELTKRRFYGKA